MEENSNHPVWKTLLAFAIIYIIWGSTFLAIRVGVREIPPFLFAAIRFLLAGLLLCGWLLAHGEPLPEFREWISVMLVALMLFPFDYGLLFWAEQRVASGIAAVMMATIPIFMALSEMVFLRTQRLTFRLLLGLFTGIAGVAVLMSHSLKVGGTPIDRAGAIALIIAAMNWSVGSVLSRRLSLPSSKLMSSGTEMFAGGALLVIAAVILGEFHRFDLSALSGRTWFALFYLVFAGSILAFSAYVWLLHHESPTKVGTYAYVNPAVAVLIGYFFGGERIDVRTIIGTVCVLMSVLIITTTDLKFLPKFAQHRQ